MFRQSSVVVPGKKPQKRYTNVQTALCCCPWDETIEKVHQCADSPLLLSLERDHRQHGSRRPEERTVSCGGMLLAVTKQKLMVSSSGC